MNCWHKMVFTENWWRCRKLGNPFYNILLSDYAILFIPYKKEVMKNIMVFFLLFLTTITYCQNTKSGKTKIIAGLSGPELLHAGVTHRIANSNLLGVNVGAGPSLGSIWPSISLEHRLYLGKNDTRINLKTWFLRQGITFFPSAKSSQQLTFNFTGGKDLPFKKKPTNGITIDAGFFYLNDSESSSIILIRSLNLWPALRFELYFSL